MGTDSQLKISTIDSPEDNVDSTPEKKVRKRDNSKDIEYLPYVQGYGGIQKLFEAIRRASVPPKFTQDFLASKLGLKSTSFRAMIPFLKRIGFLDQNNVPTKEYKEFRGSETQAKRVMAQLVKEAYGPLYEANEYAHELEKNEIVSNLRQMTGAGTDDRIIPAVAASFLELCKLSDFEDVEPDDDLADLEVEKPEADSRPQPSEKRHKVGFSYTINLNLPATTEVEVFNAIFKSLKQHILDQ